MGHGRETTSRSMRISRPGPAGGGDPGWSGTRPLRTRVLAHLAQGWSPEQVAGRLAVEAGRGVISHESIYRFLYRQLARTKDYGWRHYLPRAKWKRGWRGRKGGSPAAFMALRRPLAERPQSAAARRTPGHWEADLMLFRTYGQAVLTLQERHSRLLLALRPPGKAARPIASAMAHLLGPFPPAWRRTVTFDNGTEFARHYHLHALGIETFFCDTHSPWQKGGVENAPLAGCAARCPARSTWRRCPRSSLRS